MGKLHCMGRAEIIFCKCGEDRAESTEESKKRGNDECAGKSTHINIIMDLLWDHRNDHLFWVFVRHRQVLTFLESFDRRIKLVVGSIVLRPVDMHGFPYSSPRKYTTEHDDHIYSALNYGQLCK